MEENLTPLAANDMEQMIYDELCDVLDAPELYDDCVLAVHRKSHVVSVGSPMTFNRDYETFPLMEMFQIEEDSQDYEVDADAVADIVSRYF